MLLLSGQISIAQENIPPQYDAFRKNTFHGGLGFGGLIVTATLNYERMVTQHLDKKVSATFVKVGFGTYGSIDGSGQYLIPQYGFLTGSKANHLEVSVGPNFTLNGDLNLPVSANVGYRRQKPGKPFLIRTGVALPEAIYFGMGLSF